MAGAHETMPGNWDYQPQHADPLVNIDAEAAFLGAVLIDNGILRGFKHPLAPGHFFEPLHGRIYARIVALLETHDFVRPFTLKPYFEQDEAMRALGGPAYLARLTEDGQGLFAPQVMADQIVDLAERRALRDAGQAAASSVENLDQPISKIVEHFNSTLNALPRRAADPIITMDLAMLSEVAPQSKPFIIPRLAPAGEVTLFTGAGSAGKSLFAQQIATAVAAGVPTLGLDIVQSPAIYLTCEDDEEQLHWRQTHLCRALNVSMESLAGKLWLSSLRGRLDNALGQVTSEGNFSLSPAYERLASLIRRSGAKLVALDNVAHLFAGNENDRGDVTRFANALNRLAGETGAAILLLAHTNKAFTQGNKVGNAHSGSTAWLNAVRSQFVIEHDLDTDLRTLTIGKANYARKGEDITFAWHDWAFVRQNDLPADASADLAETIKANGENAAFLRCLAACTAQRRNVSHQPGINYAPKIFAGMPEAKGIKQKGLEAAMERLLHLGEIELDCELWKGGDRHMRRGIRAAGRSA